ncbi:MAG: hypothetical protein KC431_31660, partial [Myxococcales bacterium]|nr:hypothetical protein [Myxococcales bacterium]
MVLSACPGPDPEPEAEWTIGLEVDQSVGAFLSAWGSSRDEVYAVGGNPDAGAMARFDGSAWTDESIPDGMPLINWVHGSAGEL